MALWLIALAKGASLPRRLVYVVDRRAVVDQATRFARTSALEHARRDGGEAGARCEVQGSQSPRCAADSPTIAIWLEDPSRPAIVVGTIDMVGSRLLFEGYGVSRGMRPYHAGLLGVDVLVLLDEAHLCPPFEALLRQIESYRDGKLGPVGDSDSITPPFRLMSLSATGRDASDTSPSAVFRLEAEDREEPVVEQRLVARKRLNVTELTAGTSLAESLASRAIEVGCDVPFSRVLVYCDRRRDAGEVKELIDRECRRRHKSGEIAGEHGLELLVGERRVRERTALEKWLDEHGFLGAADQRPSAPVFLVATSAGEVGVDLNADHIVCDLVAYERMVQRLGRVNRRGGANRRATIDVLALPPELKDKAPKDAKERAERDFEVRLAPLRRLPGGDDGRRDASPSAIVGMKLKHPDVVRAATTRTPLYPELSRPLLDAWSMTSLRRHEGRPEVAPWLRGWEHDDEPQTSVVWRKYLPHVRTDGEMSVPPAMVAEYFRVVPVHATERLEAASSRVFDWMLKRSARPATHPEDHDLAIGYDEIVVILIDRAGEYRAHLTLRELRWLAAPAKSLQKGELRQRDRRKREWRDRHLPGATLVADCRLCGVRDGMLDEKCEAVATAADADEDWRGIRDPAAEGSRPLIRFLVERIGGGDDEEGSSPPTVATGVTSGLLKLASTSAAWPAVALPCSSGPMIRVTKTRGRCSPHHNPCAIMPSKLPITPVRWCDASNCQETKPKRSSRQPACMTTERRRSVGRTR